MSANQRQNKKDTRSGKQDEIKSNQKQLTLEASMANGSNNDESELLVELRKLRRENGDAFQETKQSLNRLETSVGEIKQQMEKLDKRLTTVEHRVSNAEDRSIRHERALGYLLRREARLTAKQDDMENRLRRNNIRVYGIPEEAEGKEMVPFMVEFFRTTLTLKDDVEIKLERALRAIAPKPKTKASTRSIIVRFLDFSVKQAVLQQAWKQRDITFQGQKVYFDQDYSPDVQRKRKKVREVIKRLREKNIKAQSPYPAQLKVFLDTGVKVFPSLLEAQSFLKELGVAAEIEERDVLERELTQDTWTTQDNRRKRKQLLSPTEIRTITERLDTPM